MSRLHLLCNAHLDPYWLWEWEEGAAEALSTFRTAADLCEEFQGFVFNHNEALLYRWVEEYEPELFKRIQRLVSEGKWHIMGGWYLQPDCNMPSGESFVRQILLGKTYFREKFGVEPTTAINLDPFGHTRGLAQIMHKSGYDSYVFCRPGPEDCALPANEFVWVGYDGSEIIGHRVSGWYNSQLGKARDKVENWIKNNRGRDLALLLWGVGDHGGGPSRRDLEQLRDLMTSTREVEIQHSTPEQYIKELKASGASLPRHEKDMNPWGVGCYTSQIRMKQKHRELENAIYGVEKLASNAAIQGLMAYPKDDTAAALRDLMVAEFHDILPGSSIQPVEDAGLRLLDHGLEVMSRLKARAFFALASGQPKAKQGEIPVLVYNPHPYVVRTIVECEFNLPDVNWERQFTRPVVYQNGRHVPSQVDQEISNLNLDWRKRVVFLAELQPSQMNRFDCQLEVLPERPKPVLRPENNEIRFHSDELDVVINCKTGLMDSYAVNGVEYLDKGACQPLAVADDEDPWGMRVHSYRNVAGTFKLMSPERGTQFSGVKEGVLPSVRVVEDGEVRAVVEALFEYGDSFAVLTYKLPKRGTEVEVHVRVQWNEKNTMLKLALPTALTKGQYIGQVAYGVGLLPSNGDEAVAQKWMAVVEGDKAVTCINEGTYGSDCAGGEIRLSLLRSPAYSGHPIGDRPVVPQDRFTPRIDQGERRYRFWLNAGDKGERLKRIDREALAHNEKPTALSFFPSGKGALPMPLAVLDDEAVQLAALKQAEQGSGYIIRLFEPTGQARNVTLELPPLGMKERISLGAFEIKSLRLDPAKKTLTEVDLLERG